MPTYRIRRDEKTLARMFRNLRPVGVRAALLTTTKVVIGIGLAVFGVLMILMGAYRFSLFFAATIGILLLSPYVAPWVERRKLRKSQFYGDVTVMRLDDSGVSWESTHESGRSDWPTYRHVIRKQNGFVVQMESGDALWFDNADLIEGDAEDVARLVRPRATTWSDFTA